MADDVTLGTTLKRGLTGRHLTFSGAARLAQIAGLAALTVLASLAPTDVSAQGFKWPWEEAPVRPREPVRPPPAPIPPVAPPAGVPGQSGAQWMTRSPICTQLEQRLVVENQKGAQTREMLPKIEAEMRQLDQVAQQGQRQLEKADCYEYFLFSKTLRATKQCRDIAAQAEGAKRRLGDLETQRGQIMGSSGRSYTDDIVRELARNNCGANYQQEASRASPGLGGGGIWQDEGTAAGGGFGSSQYATFRTVCVRLCDGYYFPISFSTLPGHFQQDADACQSKCAAPVELYYHPNPGGAMETGHEPESAGALHAPQVGLPLSQGICGRLFVQGSRVRTPRRDSASPPFARHRTGAQRPPRRNLAMGKGHVHNRTALNSADEGH